MCTNSPSIYSEPLYAQPVQDVGIIPHYTCGEIAFFEQDCPLCLEVDTVMEAAEGDPSLKANVM